MWHRLDVVFALRSPIHIGYLPFKGSVISPTRYYVPGKNFWGAITQKVSEILFPTPSSENYIEIGKQVKDNFRFSYFYLYDDETIFIPAYTDKGLLFGDDKNKQIDKLEFERRFIGSRVLTSINSETGTAKDESLHEIEFVKDKFIDEKGKTKNTNIIGCIWVKKDFHLDNHKIEIKDNGIFVNSCNIIEELTLGGEQGYGFGLLKLEKILKEKRFPIKDNSEGKEIKIYLENNYVILSHLRYDKNVLFKGEVELLTGRGYFDVERTNNNTPTEKGYKKGVGRIFSSIDYYYAPGTVVKSENKEFQLEWNGVLRKIEDL